VSDADPRRHHGRWARRGEALLETALVLPVLLFLAFGVVGAGRVTQARLGLAAVVREAARAAAESRSAGAGRDHALAVARGYGLADRSLDLLIDGGQFEPGGRVVSVATYTVSFGDLPLLGWANVRVRAEAWEAIDLYRSGK
jgi:hypothetical protein